MFGSRLNKITSAQSQCIFISFEMKNVYFPANHIVHMSYYLQGEVVSQPLGLKLSMTK